MIFTLSGILLLCILVVIHEFGHFIVAKAFGVRVLTFSVGFGPKLLKWKIGYTEYCLSAIPLGGYVRMLGDSPTDELTDEEKRMSYLHQPFLKKSLIALAGPVFNLVLPIFLFFFMILGTHTTALPILGTIVPGEAAARAGLLPGDRVLKVDGVSVDTYRDFAYEISQRPAQEMRLEIERNGTLLPMAIVVTPKALPDPNPVNIGEKVGYIGASSNVRRPRVAVTDPRSAAAIAGLKTFDEVLSVNGEKIDSYDALESALATTIAPLRLTVQRGDNGKSTTHEITINAASVLDTTIAIDSKVKRFAVLEDELKDEGYLAVYQRSKAALEEFVKKQPPYGISFVDAVVKNVQEDSAAFAVGLKAGDRIVAINGKMAGSWEQILRAFHSAPDEMHVLAVLSEGMGSIAALRLKPAKEKSAFESEPPKQLGVMMTVGAYSYKEGPTKEIYMGVIASLGEAFDNTVELIKVICKSLYLLATFAVPGSQMAGPLTIFSAAGEAASNGLSNYMWLMALISVNLGILNLLPIPILDGGHLLMFTIEFVTRRPLTLRTRQVATSIGLTFILMLMFLAIFNDISRLVS